MDINKLTIKSQEALQRAQQITLMNGQQLVENAHILKGVLEVDENVTPFLFKKLGVNIDRFEQALECSGIGVSGVGRVQVNGDFPALSGVAHVDLEFR